MANNLLIVEGKSDKQFIQAFIKNERLGINLDIRVVTAPEVDQSLTHTTKQAVFQSLKTVIKQLNDGRYDRIGVLIDMDYTLDSQTNIKAQNLNQLSHLLNSEGFFLRCNSDNKEGIFFDNPDFEHPIGVWMMPDNINEGYLEHWIEQSIKKDEQGGLYNKVETFINAFDDDYFKSHVVTKAKIYTWLAIQPKPSQDMSRCLSPKFDLLDKQSASYQNFKNWLIATFI